MSKVTLRDFKTSDVGRLVDILNQPSVTQFLSTKIPSPYTKEDAIWWIEEGSKEGFIRAVEYDGELVGVLVLTQETLNMKEPERSGTGFVHHIGEKGLCVTRCAKLSPLLSQTQV